MGSESRLEQASSSLANADDPVQCSVQYPQETHKDSGTLWCCLQYRQWYVHYPVIVSFGFYCPLQTIPTPVNLVFIFTFRSGLLLNFITKHTTTNPWHTTHFHFCTLMMMMMMMRRFVKRVLNSPQRRCQSIKQYKQSNYQTLCMTEQSRLDHQFNSHESSMNNYRTHKRPWLCSVKKFVSTCKIFPGNYNYF